MVILTKTLETRIAQAAGSYDKMHGSMQAQVDREEFIMIYAHEGRALDASFKIARARANQRAALKRIADRPAHPVGMSGNQALLAI